MCSSTDEHALQCQDRRQILMLGGLIELQRLQWRLCVKHAGLCGFQSFATTQLPAWQTDQSPIEAQLRQPGTHLIFIQVPFE